MNYKQQLQAILKAANWSQEQLATELRVSFPALNAWLNDRAVPRVGALQRIQILYLSIIGVAEVSLADLELAKEKAFAYTMTAKSLVTNKEALDKLTLYLTYHTNTIEGSTMTITDVEDVLFEHKVLANRTAIEQTEARNHQAALYWLLDTMVQKGKRFIVTEDLILGLHLRLMNGIISDAGRYRNHTVRISGMHVALANWQKIPELMAELIGSSEHTSGDVIALLAYTHATFEKIHPFSDGNGRVGRLVLLAQALSAGFVLPLVVKERKQAYYKYLQEAQMAEKYFPLEFFMAESMVFCGELVEVNLGAGIA